MHQKLHTKCTVMERRTMTMNWEGLLDDDDDDRFFESFDRLPSAVPIDLASSGSDDDEGDDSRTSFASAMSSAPIHNMRGIDPARAQASMLRDFNMWMAEPGSIKERRRRLLQGMGLSSNKNLLSRNNTRLKDSCSKRMNYDRDQPSTMSVNNSSPLEDLKLDTSPSPSSTPIFLIRSRSDGDIESFSANTRKRKEEFIGNISKQRLTRTSSMLVTPHGGICQYANTVKVSPKRSRNRSSMLNSAVLSSILSDGQFGAFFLIKNLDTGKEFIVKEFNDDGMWNRLSEVQTGKQLTMEEFEKCVGYSPVVKELMRRENVSRSLDDARKINTNSYLSKRFRNSKRRGVALLKNIKGVANSMSGLIVDKERDHSIGDQRTNKNSTNKWIKVRQHGKSIKEFTALHLCQEIQAHEGSIWTMRFNPDGHYLASAGEDRVIHVWEVQECEVTSVKPYDDYNSVSSTPLHPMARSMSDRPSSFTEISPMPSERRKERLHLAELSPMLSERRKRGKGSTKKKGNLIPDYVHVPETVFSLSERPLLLSASMDKTVRLWDMETRSCLKLFAHNDYVTCIQFNPTDDDYFISGSLDAKVRIWSIPDRKLVDYTDLHEMVTSACYTPDGQAVAAGAVEALMDRLPDFEKCDAERALATVELLCRIQSGCAAFAAHALTVPLLVKIILKISDRATEYAAGALLSLCSAEEQCQREAVAAGVLTQLLLLVQSDCTERAKRKAQMLLKLLRDSWPDDSIANSDDFACSDIRRDTGQSKTAFVTFKDPKALEIALLLSGATIVDQIVSIIAAENYVPKDDVREVRMADTVFAPSNTSEVLVTSADSRIRIIDGSEIIHKFRGFRNTSSQISASFSPDGKYVVCASEDSQVYIWKREEQRNAGAGKRKLVTTHSHEHFQCRDVSVAIPWPGSIKFEPPVVEVHSKRHSKHSTPCPPTATGSPTQEDILSGSNGKRLPPLPKRNSLLERTGSCQDEELAQVPCTDSGFRNGESFSLGSSSVRYGYSPSISGSGSSPSQTWSSSWSLLEGSSHGGHGSHAVQATAWGLVIVTAGLGGEIRAYQNFGLPVRVRRQTNLFRDLT
ncbi:hypothetical protein TEA_006757 [Camellia sinensis var. sinensis]|uniref:U-box domain-containing protein n=1 Tax=Camellia sinensis var. sinensis TaxID=542762 RepID=A0A4S4DC19_CAMSN|nr:hypothetical protein TEA_006757 [Camellia sinensis var. sinensis]